jgi:hypothetical protein
MEPIERYRRYADECRRIALATHLSDEDRALLLEIARDWLFVASPELLAQVSDHVAGRLPRAH